MLAWKKEERNLEGGCLHLEHSARLLPRLERDRAPPLDGASGTMAKTNGSERLFDLSANSSCNTAAQLRHTG